MSGATPERRVPEIFRRYISATAGDFVTSTEAMRDLGEVLEQLARDALGDKDDRGRWISTDGVAIDTVQTADRRIECQCQLWLLTHESRSVPLHATFWLADDLASVAAYRVQIADIDRDHDASTGRRMPETWAIVVDWPQDGQELI